ncbi:MAG: response regulator [Candidatus Liptonbacteria bacterium]|nr:response regulator [Candidatus Liptonbacteria bacterium]
MGNQEAKTLILLVEDEADFREIFSIKLKQAGFEVVTAENGADALEKLKTVKPSCVVMDFQMPILNGVETFQKIKENPELTNLKVVFMTNHGEPLLEMSDVDKKFAEEIGAANFFRKTDELSISIDKIRQACGG